MSHRNVRLLAALAGAAFLLAGVLGFLPGVTTHHGELSFAGRDSRAELVGVFRVSVLLNLAHVLLGAAGLALARTAAGARAFLVGGGIASLVLWLVGVVGAGGFIPVDRADNWLHFTLGLGTIGLARATGRAAV